MNFNAKNLLNYENKLESKGQKRHFYADASKNVHHFWSEEKNYN
jgi:hypothetical protein